MNDLPIVAPVFIPDIWQWFIRDSHLSIGVSLKPHLSQSRSLFPINGMPGFHDV